MMPLFRSTAPSYRRRALTLGHRSALCNEESRAPRKDELKKHRDNMEELVEARDVTEQADALVDAIYYICDTAVRHGMNLDRIFEIVHRANMQKVVNGRVIRREDGKILKPEGWQDPAPFLTAEIQRQQSEGSWS